MSINFTAKELKEVIYLLDISQKDDANLSGLIPDIMIKLGNELKRIKGGG